MNQSRNQVSNWLLVLGVVALVVAPLIIVRGSEFAGADGQAEEIIKQVKPDYKPWFEPILAPPGGETESLLFASQAGLGAGLIGYVIGFYRGRQRQ
ncbi:energy-coupling factor ABC transporter substrate-binding protein [Calothrix sp. NIES-3974]|uniref:energy-coupling factor ABC transporter substrate-binding protein n=1 Tax=Calothrix sp. NIES-3974 TaxID=2005462 RepID=UPI000B5E3235|nr:energy-coupling factor ABC transporter substrate-binding protein [Calothrix sp. NIES-3974]BAZ04983.1 cobalt transport protein CbiN [Calothrix sp. NIES-3974]